MSGHILLAYGFDGNGGGQPLNEKEISHQLEDEKLAWVHLDATHPDTRPWLEEEIAYLDPFIIEALMEQETRPRMTQIGDGALLILRGVNLNENADPEDMVAIRLWVDSHRIISLRRRKLKAVRDIEDTLKSGNGPKDAGQFVCMLVGRLFERLEPALAALDDTTDLIEEKILESVDASLREEIVDVRKQAIMFRRYMAPQREAIGQLRIADFPWLDTMHKRQLQENLNDVTRYIEDLDTVRERSQLVKDELTNIMSERLNKNTYVLSVIAAIFLPLGFLTGLLGINVGGIPGTDNNDSFYIFCALLVAVVAVQVIVFKKLKWF